MEITKFKKYVSWNIISLLGYFCIVIMIAFIVMYSLVHSQINMRADLNKYFYEYLHNHVVVPYLSFYKVQICLIISLLIISIFEKNYYKENDLYGFQIFENNEKRYSQIFAIGLIMNLLPMYLFTMFIFIQIMKHF